MKTHVSTVYASAYDKVVPPGTWDMYGGFEFRAGKTRATGSLEGNAHAIGQLIGQLMSYDFLSFEERVDFTNLIVEIMSRYDHADEARRALHLATRGDA